MPGRASAANAVRQQVVDYVGDRLGARTALAFAGWGARAQAGLLSQALVGLDDNSRTLTGYIGRPVQGFTGESVLGANPVAYRDGVNTMDTQLSGEGMADPARRLLAERLRRRR
jgi:hypothetical protein